MKTDKNIFEDPCPESEDEYSQVGLGCFRRIKQPSLEELEEGVEEEQPYTDEEVS